MQKAINHKHNETCNSKYKPKSKHWRPKHVNLQNHSNEKLINSVYASKAESTKSSNKATKNTQIISKPQIRSKKGKDEATDLRIT